jgi:putative endonuclease
MNFFVYILQSDSGRYYIRSTNDIDRRLRQHLSGHTPTTMRMTGLKMVFKQEFESLTIARRVEKKIKSWKRKDFIDKIVDEQEIKFFK